MPAKKTTASKTKTKGKTPAKKGTAKKRAIKRATEAKTTLKKATPSASSRSATPVSRSSAPAKPARRGDLIVIDSVQVGSPTRQGEILRVVVGKVSVSYQVRWGDGHESLITPVAGTAHIVRT